MITFETAMERYGECVVQSLLDDWEKFEYIQRVEPLPLEERWNKFLYTTDKYSTILAA